MRNRNPRICDHWSTDPPKLHLQASIVHGSILRTPKLFNFDFNADPDLAFHSDPDPASKKNAEPSGSATLRATKTWENCREKYWTRQPKHEKTEEEISKHEQSKHERTEEEISKHEQPKLEGTKEEITDEQPKHERTKEEINKHKQPKQKRDIKSALHIKIH